MTGTAPTLPEVAALQAAAGGAASLRVPEECGDGPDAVRAIALASRLPLRLVRWTPPFPRGDDGLPVVGFLDDRAVALLPGRPWRLVDGGRERPLTPDLAQRLQPYGFQVHAGAALPRRRPGDAAAFAAAAVPALGAAVLALAPALAAWTATPDSLPWTLAGVLAAVVAAGLMRLAAVTASFRMASRIAVRHGGGAIDRLLRLPIAAVRRSTPEDLSDAGAAVGGMADAIGHHAPEIIAGTGAAIVGLVALTLMSPPAGMLTGAVVIGESAVRLALSAARHRQRLRQRSTDREIDRFFFAMASGIPRLRQSSAAAGVAARARRQLDRQQRQAQTGQRLAAIETGLAATMPLAAAAVALAAVMTDTGLAPAAAVTAALLGALCQRAAATAAAGLAGVVEARSDLRAAAPSLRQATEDEPQGEDPGRLTGAVTLEAVGFRYPGAARPLLSGLSLRLRPGEIVGISGPSGCGKSTLLRLLLGFERPDGGRILYDGRDLRQLDVIALRRAVGAVLQGQGPEGGTIYRMILGSAPLSLDDAWAAARTAAVDGDIRRMAMGMQAVVNRDTLSGSQYQRLLLARALVRRPRLLLLDEATSSLDDAEEAVVLGNLRALGLTCLLVSHSPGTLRHADRVHVLGQGAKTLRR